VTVTDDGPAVAGPGQEPATGHGIVGMRERAAAYSGQLRAGSAGPQGGWCLVATLDLRGARA
jgi:signal transduction histidine kinase